MKLFFKKIIWLFITMVGYFAICFMLELPMTTVVYSIIDREDPAMVTTVTLVFGFLLILYAVYLKRLRNDKERREYLTNIRRKYGNFKTDAMYIIKTKAFQWEVAAFGVLNILWAIRALSTGAIQGNLFTYLFLLVCLPLVLVLFAGGNLLILNKVHRDWLAALEVPEDADEVVELRHKHRAVRRNLIIQFAFSLSFFILYLLNSYAVTFSVVVTPALFLYSHVQSIMGVTHMRNIDQPYKLYGILHCVSLAFYIFALMFGVFAPK